MCSDTFPTRVFLFDILRIQVFGTFLAGAGKGNRRGKGIIFWPLHTATLILLVQQQKYIISHCSSKTWVEMCTTDFKHLNSHLWQKWWFSHLKVLGDVTSKRPWNLLVIINITQCLLEHHLHPFPVEKESIFPRVSDAWNLGDCKSSQL